MHFQFIRPTRCTLASTFAFLLIFLCSAARAQTTFDVTSATGQCVFGTNTTWQLDGPSGTMTVNMDDSPAPCEMAISVGNGFLPLSTAIGAGNSGGGTVNGTPYTFFFGGVVVVGGSFFLGSPLTDLTVVVPVTSNGGMLTACYPQVECFADGGLGNIPVLIPPMTGTATIGFTESNNGVATIYSTGDNVTYQLTATTPEPPSWILFGSALLIMIVWSKFKLASS